MFPVKLSPVKASLDSVLDTAKSTLRLPSNTPTPPVPTAQPATPSPPSQPPPAATPAASSAPLTDRPSPVVTPAPTEAPPISPAPLLNLPPAVNPPAPLPPQADPPASPQPPSIAPVRPAAAPKPSWIGPPRPVAPTPTMKHPATVEYVSKGLQPPVYIFTSLSDLQWEAVEMDHDRQASGENRFYKTFTADEGEYQYKFRLGPGDWWALDDSKATVDDGQGNKNNLMVVKPEVAAQIAPQPQKDEVKPGNAPTSQPPNAPSQPVQISTPVIALQPAPSDDVNSMRPAGPLMPHEQSRSTEVSPPPAAAAPEATPLLKHESFLPEVKPGVERDEEDGWDKNDGDDDDDANLVDDDDDDVYEHQQNPLLRHETLGPDADEQVHSPLLRHESARLGEHLDESDHTYYRSSTAPLSTTSNESNPEDAICPEADPNDPSLAMFPTDHAGIYEHIRLASTQLPEDETEDEVNSTSPLLVGRERSISPVQSLPSVQEEDEDEDEDLDHLREQERIAADKEAQTTKVDPLAAGVPELLITGPNERRPAALITPPMTPKEADQMVERIVEQAAEEMSEKQEVVVMELVQERGIFGAMADMFMHTMSLIAFAGIALAVAAGVWKLRYA